MAAHGFWSRVREAHLVRVLVIYLAASWLLLQVTSLFIDAFDLPKWFMPAAVLLLSIGLVIVTATAWVQSHPSTPARAGREEVPSSWEIDLGDFRNSVARGHLPHLTWARSVLGGIVAFSLLFGLAGVYVLVKDRGQTLGPKAVEAAPGTALAVLPFRVVGQDVDLWREGMVDLLSANLDGAAGIRAVAPRTVLSRWHGKTEGTAEPTDPEALQVAREVGARYALLGTLVVLGGEVRLTAQVVDLKSGKVQGEAQVKGAPDSIPALVDRLSLDVVRTALAREGDEATELDLRGVSTSSLPALKAYLAGERAFRRSRWEDAAAEFARAVEADSTFALALYRLSVTYGWIDGRSARVAEYTRRASQFANRLPDREALLLRGYSSWGRESFQNLETLTQRYPDDAEGWVTLGEAYNHDGGPSLVPFDKFRQAFRRAIELDPSFGAAYIHLIGDAFDRADSADARGLISRYVRIEANSPDAQGSKLAYALAWGDEAAKRNALAALDTASTGELDRTSLDLGRAYRFWQENLSVLRALALERHPVVDRQGAVRGLARVLVWRGRLREARQALLSTPEEEPYGPMNSRTLLLWRLLDFPDGGLAPRAASALAADPTLMDRFLIGAHAAADGQTQELERQLAAIDSLARQSGAQATIEEGEPIDIRALARALEAYAASRRGDRARAIRGLEEALPDLPGSCPGGACGTHIVLRFLLGKWLLEQGDAAEAERYLASTTPFRFYVPTDLYLGKAYEALGDMDQARRHYGEFVEAWKDCDPELRPWWEDARQGLRRLEQIKKL
jgi:serine/threonine-protein kinase